MLVVLTRGNILFDDLVNTAKVELWVSTFITLLFVFTFSSFICTLYCFYKVKRCFIYKLEGKYTKTLGAKTKAWINISIITSLV